jgi:hypothetical protein
MCSPNERLGVLHLQLAGDELGQQCVAQGGEGTGFQKIRKGLLKQSPSQSIEAQ